MVLPVVAVLPVVGLTRPEEMLVQTLVAVVVVVLITTLIIKGVMVDLES